MTDPELARFLRHVRLDRFLTASEVADALWLASHITPEHFSRDLPGRSPNQTSKADEEYERSADPVPPDETLGGKARPPDGESAKADGASVPFHRPLRYQQRIADGAQSASAVGGARANLLPGSLDIARALRPLKTTVPMRGRAELDEAATAQALAVAKQVTASSQLTWGLADTLVTKTRTERWLDLELVIDTGATMAVWHPTIAHLRLLLERHGAFRNVKTRWLDGTGRSIRFRTSPTAQSASPPPLTGERHLVLFVTDALGPHWREPRLAPVLRQWQRSGPTAIVQLLPQRMWDRTRLTARPVEMRARASGAGRFVTRPREPWQPFDKGDPSWIPVLELDAEWIGPWAGALRGQHADWIPGMAVDVAGAIDYRDEPRLEEVSPLQMVRRFKFEASPQAFELGALLAAAPLTLPAMRFVQSVMMPDSSPVHLAEVYLSNLLVQVTASENPDTALYEFRDGVREQMLKSLTRREAFTVLEQLRQAPERVAAPLGGMDFHALIPDSAGSLAIPAESRAFAYVAATVFAGLGGRFESIARQLVDLVPPVPAVPVTRTEEHVRRPPADVTRTGSWAAKVDTRALSRSVVRVEWRDPETGNMVLLGTGFFVAPGWVLTCAHVVGDSVKVLVRAHGEIAAEPLPGVVAARSEQSRGDGSALWPFPDLALIRLPGAPAHPCVLLGARDPAVDIECHAWGYALREDGVDPVGSPASFLFEGVEGDGFFKLKAGRAAPGLSGAPLVCPVQRAVVGVVVASRRVGGNLGWYAVPIAALVDGWPFVPSDLRGIGARVAVWNRAAVLADRAGWHAVLPVDGAEEAVEQGWAPFVRREKSSPADLLRADFGVVPYLFRERDLDDAAAWCQEPVAVSIAQLVGGAGAGKTRFAIELCKRMAGRGWVAGFWRLGERAAQMPLPRLLVIDYAEAADPEALRIGLDQLRRSADEVAPVRILLLTRTKAGGGVDPLDALYENASVSVRTLLDASINSTAGAHHLALPQRQTLYTEAIERFTAAWWPSGRPAAGRPSAAAMPDLSDDRYSVPLEVLFEAHDRALRTEGSTVPGGESGGISRPPVDRVLAHEQRYWTATAPQVLGLDYSLLRRCVALATLAGAADDVQAHALLSILPELAGTDRGDRRRRIRDWLAGLYEGPGRLNPLRPDRLGEALIASVLHDADGMGDGLLAGVLALPHTGQLVQVVDQLTRVAIIDPQTARDTAQELAVRLRLLIVQAEAQARPQAGQQARHTLATGLSRLLTGPLAGFLADPEIIEGADESEYRRSLSINYVRLGDLARNAGQVDQARILYTQMLDIDAQLAAAEPDNPQYQRYLSVDYVRFGELALDAGRTELARNFYTQAQFIRERLAAAYPDNLQYQRDLSVSLVRLGDLALGAGQVERARVHYTLAQEIHARVAAADPDNPQYQSDLSVDFVRLGDLALNAGQADEARNLYTKAQFIHERLVIADPDNPQYQRDLALGLVRLGDLARNVGQDDRARNLFGQALVIHQRLAAADPDKPQYQRNLSIDYGRLGDLALHAGRPEEARNRYLQAQAIHQRLAASDPDSPQHQRSLSVDYVRLADLALSAGQPDQAWQLFGRALEIDLRLATADPDNSQYQRDLSVDYARLGDLALSTGQVDRARSNYVQALSIQEQLAVTDPDNAQYQQDLELSRDRLARLAEHGSPPPG